jgi:hypothetical protein
MAAHHERHARGPASGKFLLAGLVYCGECGSTMTGRCIPGYVRREGTQGPDWLYYGCNDGVDGMRKKECAAGYVPQAALEARIWGLVERMVATPAVVEEYATAAEETHLPGWREQLERSRKLRGYVAVKKERAWQLYVNGHIEEAEYVERRGEIEAEAAGAARDAETYGRLVETAELRLAAVGRVRSIAESLQGRLGELSLEERRRVLLQLGFRVTVFCEDWKQKAAKRTYRVRAEWAGQAFIEAAEQAEAYAGSYAVP